MLALAVGAGLWAALGPGAQLERQRRAAWAWLEGGALADMSGLEVLCRGGGLQPLLEALAHGLAPIVRDVGGVREVLTPELEAWMLPYEADSDAFRAVIERALALTDEELLVGGHVLDRPDTLADFDVQHAVDQQDGVAMGQEFEDLVDVHQASSGFG